MDTKDSPQPLYWYKEHWLQRIYNGGVEISAQSLSKRTFKVEKGLTQFTSKDLRGECPYYWDPVLNVWKEEGEFPCAKVIGFQLLAKERKDGEFAPIVELIRGEVIRGEVKDPYRLYSCKEFGVGDAVMFCPLFEETEAKDALGSNYLRISDNYEETNVHMTMNRLLRCARPIRKGEEIVRWSKQKTFDPFFEKVDRLVFSSDKELLGRIGQQQTRDSITIQYTDGSSDVATGSSYGIGLGYRDTRTVR